MCLSVDLIQGSGVVVGCKLEGDIDDETLLARLTCVFNPQPLSFHIYPLACLLPKSITGRALNQKEQNLCLVGVWGILLLIVRVANTLLFSLDKLMVFQNDNFKLA